MIILVAFLLVQPLLGTEAENCEVKCSSAAASTCKADDDAEGQPAQDCARNKCNPLMSCSSGNFYIVEGFFLAYVPGNTKAIKILSSNDNRVLSSFSECWHPPELAYT